MNEARTELPHNWYETPDAKTIKLISDDVLVRMDKPRETTSGGIIIPDTAGDRGDAGILITGTILAYGFRWFGGKKGKPLVRLPLRDLQVGQKTVFIRYYAEQHSNQQLQYRIEDRVIRMKAADLLFTFDPEDMDRVLR